MNLCCVNGTSACPLPLPPLLHTSCLFDSSTMKFGVIISLSHLQSGKGDTNAPSAISLVNLWQFWASFLFSFCDLQYL
jgi:hypothetical protein